ncbi:uncharacterized protein LOC129219246 [Uloborus diversus]|uniref:uncharacterized protein LOC129219246 n=1 Tax=Uloborus diversus TaxID=327109 RepID=UPI00240981A9|nr:uncharacterized protein LOC129219246 [Uloborus diversus]
MASWEDLSLLCETERNDVRVSSPKSSSGGSSPDSRSSRVKQKQGKPGTSPLAKDNRSDTVSIQVPDVRIHFQAQEVSALQREVEVLRLELSHAQNTIHSLQEREQKLKARLAEQAQKMLERGVRFESLALGEKRPTALVRHYGNLYAQARVDTLDALDALPPLKDADELKTKILFSVIVLAFRSVQNTLSDIKYYIKTTLKVSEDWERDPAVSDVENAIALYLRKTADSFPLSKNVQDVCAQIHATLYDYPCLKRCTGLQTYVRDCVRLAWCLTNQNPAYFLDYETRTFRRDMHVRFHTSNQNSDTIKSYLWPTLTEGENGPCVHKGVVLT